MKRFLLLTALLLAAFPLFAQDVYYSTNADHSTNVATAAGELATSLGGTATGFNSGVSANWVAALAGADVIFIGQSAETVSVDAPTRADISAWVSAGGRLLVLRDQPNLDLLNDVTGSSMALGGNSSNNPANDATKTPEAAGTSFDSAPETLAALNDYGWIDTATLSANGVAIYKDPSDNTHVMVEALGSGAVAYFAWDWCCGDTVEERDAWDSALLAGATVALDAVAAVARFNVIKTFSDLSTDSVEVTLTCNGGLPLTQSFTIAGGDPAGVTFVVTNVESGPTCSVTETGGTEGYETNYIGGDDGISCTWAAVSAGLYSCVVDNQALPGTFTVNKEWLISENGGGDDVDRIAEVVITCNMAILNGDQQPGDVRVAVPLNGYLEYTKTGTIVGNGELEAIVDTSTGSAMCSAEEILEQSGVETTDDCGLRTIDAGDASECTITNTVFFEGIPSLNQYGLAIMALLMLGVGMVGFRRFA